MGVVLGGVCGHENAFQRCHSELTVIETERLASVDARNLATSNYKACPRVLFIVISNIR